MIKCKENIKPRKVDLKNLSVKDRAALRWLLDNTKMLGSVRITEVYLPCNKIVKL